MTAIIEAFRYAFWGKSDLTMSSLGITTFITTTILILGVIILNRVERTFVDTV